MPRALPLSRGEVLISKKKINPFCLLLKVLPNSLYLEIAFWFVN